MTILKKEMTILTQARNETNYRNTKGDARMETNKLTREICESIIFKHMEMHKTVEEISKEFGFSISYVGNVIRCYRAVKEGNWDYIVSCASAPGRYRPAQFVVEIYSKTIPKNVVERFNNEYLNLAARRKSCYVPADEGNGEQPQLDGYGADMGEVWERYEIDYFAPLLKAVESLTTCVNNNLLSIYRELHETHEHMNVNSDTFQTLVKDQTESIKTTIRKKGEFNR